MVGAFLFVTVGRDVGYLPGSEYLPAMPRQVANVHAMHIQALVFHGGLIAFLSGVICAVGAEIKDAVDRTAIAPEPASTQSAASSTDKPAEPEKTGYGVALALLFGMLAVLVIGIALSSSNTNRAGDSDASANAANAMNAATDAMNQAASDAQNAAEQVTREVEEAARAASRPR
jgi:hypothetical protein